MYTIKIKYRVLLCCLMVGFLNKNFVLSLSANNSATEILSLENHPHSSYDTPVSLCQCACGERNEDSRIVGGKPADAHKFPWMVKLSLFDRFYCGGSLINDRYVLTAAHCVKGFMWFMIKVALGVHNKCDDSTRPETRFVVRTVSGAFSVPELDNDIAILRLNERVPITQHIKPICLPKAEDDYVGRIATVAGWGSLKEKGKASCILQEVGVPVLSNEECRKTNYMSEKISDNMFCAGYPAVGQKDSCQGDSGGPLMVERKDKRFELIGIASWGIGCARPGYPGVYTRVTRYLEWIIENTKDGCFCQD